jgi:hypothetical protein
LSLSVFSFQFSDFDHVFQNIVSTKGKQKQERAKTQEMCVIASPVLMKHLQINPRYPVGMYKEYRNRRPRGFCNSTDPFYLAVVTNKENPRNDDQWFLRGPVGKNKIRVHFYP